MLMLQGIFAAVECQPVIVSEFMWWIACIQDEQNSLRLMTFQVLLTSGRDMVDVLIKRLIDLYICDSAATDAISARLRDVCPSLYSCGDELYSKVCLMPMTHTDETCTKNIQKSMSDIQAYCASRLV